MKPFDRRGFLKGTLMTAAALGLPATLSAQSGRQRASTGNVGGMIIDTNVDIHCWPFRNLKNGQAAELAAKLQKHKIGEAWTGSFDALFHKNIDSVNQRLTEDCKANGRGILVPFGTVNPAFPDWQEDLRRCHEVYKMPGIRLHPVYHGYTLEAPEFKELLDGATKRGLLVQIAIDMEDERMQHPLVNVPAVDVDPLPAVLDQIRGARVMLVNPFRHVRGEKLQAMVDKTEVTFEISNLDGTAGLRRIIDGEHWYLRTAVPANRLTFGSHMPFFPVENSLFKLVESPLTEQELAAVMTATAKSALKKS